MNLVQNENKGIQILYRNALSGSIVNSDLLFRSIKADFDGATETLNKIIIDELRSKDRDLHMYVLQSMSYVELKIVSLEDQMKTLTMHTRAYVESTKDEDCDVLIDTLAKLREELSLLDSDITNASNTIEDCIDEFKSSKARIILTETAPLLSTLAMHVTQLYIVILTTEGSANQCKMIY